MTSPDLPQQPPADAQGGEARSSEQASAEQAPQPAPTENATREVAPAPPPAHASTPASASEGGQPEHEASVAPAEATDEGGEQGEEGDEEPAPGNEAAQPQQAGAPGTGKRKRRRRKKKPAGEGAAAGAQPGHAPQGEGGAPTGEPGAEAQPAEAGEAAGKEGGKKRDKGKKKDKGPRPERERPAFNVGDVVFGKILEITDDAVFVDLAGKGKGIFDRREMDLPDEPPPGPGEHPARHHEEEEASAGGEAGESADASDASGASEAPHGDEAAAANGGGEAIGTEATRQAAPPVATTEPTPEPTPKEVATTEPTPEASAAGTQPETSAHAGETPASAGAEQAQAPAAHGEAGAPAEATSEAAGAEATAAPTEAGAMEAGAPTEGGSQPIWPKILLEVGQQFVGMVHNDGGRGGLVVLTRHPRRVERAKLVVGGAFKEKGEVLGLITGVIKGGVEVDVDGLRAFAPGSHMDLRLGADLHHLVGKRLLFKVTQYAKKGRDVVLSRKEFLEAEAKIAREEALKRLEVGSVVEGTVRSVVSFGAFIDVGGVEGLVPLSEMSHNRSEGPHDVFKAGEKTPVKIVKVDEKGKIWLSRKAAIPDPWNEVAKKYPQGSKHTGKVARLQPFGAFIELEPGIDGLIHTADLSIKRIEHPSEVVKEGDAIDVVVAHLDVGAHKIGLHPAPTGEAANETPQRVQLHKMAKVAVVGHDPGGLIVRILGATGRHARGFITSAGTGTPRGTDLRKAFPLGTQIDAKVVELDPKRGEVKLSIKAMQDDSERTAYRQYREQVTRESKFGTFGDLLAKKLGQQK